MRILLTMAYTNEMDKGTPPHGILVLAAILEKQYDIKVVFPIDVDKFFKNYKNFEDFSVVGFSVNSFNWYSTMQYIEVIHERFPNTKIILGGPHASIMHEYCLRSTNANIVVRGEGEITLPLVIEALKNKSDLSYIDGITYKTDNGEIIVNKSRALLTEAELNSLPIPAYHLIPKNRYEFIPFETSRGCKFHCAFCAIPFPGIRYFNIERTTKLLETVESYSNNFMQNAIFITDDSFTANKQHFEEVVKLLGKSTFKVGCEARISEILRYDLFDLLDSISVYMVQVGVECGYPEGLKKVRKGISIEKIKDFAIRCQNREFRKNLYWSFIIGFPWESESEIIQTINFAFDCAAYANSMFPQVNNFAPYPGTDITLKFNEYNGKQIADNYYDEQYWFTDFLGQTNISDTKKEYIKQYLNYRFLHHPMFTVDIQNSQSIF